MFIGADLKEREVPYTLLLTSRYEGKLLAPLIDAELALALS